MPAPVPTDTKLAILEDTKTSLLAGDTLAQTAARHGITSRCLHKWLASLGDEYVQLRQQWVDNMLDDAGDELERADDPVRIARARELWKRATWYAERRDARYRVGPQVAVNTAVQITLSPDDLAL